MSKIYLPTKYVDMPCKVINNGYIRVYSNDQHTEYYDIYVNQDYMVKPGTTSYSQNITCDTSNEYTDEVYYRTDFDKVLVILIIMTIFMFLIPFKIILRLFRRFR